jgi:ElaB/YqjD/DUF883 family membrane-anchored ribosome-binding protein
MEILRADLSTLAATVAELAQSKGADLSQAAKDQIAAARETAANQADVAKEKALHLHDQAHDFARNQPATALGIAAGLGFLIGMMMTRK